MAEVFRQKRGARIGKYELLTRLAQGVSGEVWRARDTIEGVQVALKVYGEAGGYSDKDLLSEIRIASAMEHPNILRIKNADRVGNYYLMATALAIETLEHRLRRRLSTRRAIHYIHQFLQGLAYAHEQRVIHRDLKPSNLLLFGDDQLKIADFGIAKVSTRTMLAASASGTTMYMAPEQAHGYPCFASDVFSAGLMMYEILVHRVPHWPFRWPYPGQQQLRLKVPPELIELLRKATHTHHRQRHKDGTVLLAAYERCLPAIEKFLQPQVVKRRSKPRLGQWRSVRFRECERSFGRRLFLRFFCPDCDGPISEHMHCCPWCGQQEIRFGARSSFPRYCDRCHKGLRDEWCYCPWCWGQKFSHADGVIRADRRYKTTCGACAQPLIEGMRYCAWCHTRVTEPIRIRELPDRCGKCKSSVTAALWAFCPWCHTSIRPHSPRVSA